MLLELQKMLHPHLHPSSSTTAAHALSHTPLSPQPMPQHLVLFPEIAFAFPPPDGVHLQAANPSSFVAAAGVLAASPPPCNLIDDILKFAQPVDLQESAAVKKSFADVVEHGTFPLQQSLATIKEYGPYKTVKINQSAYERRVHLCTHFLIGRLILSKGDSPWKIKDLKAQLSKIWGLKEQWRLISLGKGYYNVFLTTPEAKAVILGRGAINVKPGIFRLQPWVRDFDPNAQKTTTAQVWVRIFQLPWEYWDPLILADIAKSLGCLLRIDKATLDGDYGHFARILVDIDLSLPIQSTVGIEREGGHVWVTFGYEHLPSFCKLCSSIGHLPYQCRHEKSFEGKNVDEGVRKFARAEPTIPSQRRAASPPPKRGQPQATQRHPFKAAEEGVPTAAPQMGVYQRGRTKNAFPVKQVFERIIEGTTRRTAPLNDMLENVSVSPGSGTSQPGKWRDIAARAAEEGGSSSPIVTALEKDVTLSPLEGSSFSVKETPLRQPWSSDSEDEPIKGFIPSDYYNSFSVTHSWQDYDHDARYEDETPWVVSSSKTLQGPD